MKYFLNSSLGVTVFTVRHLWATKVLIYESSLVSENRCSMLTPTRSTTNTLCAVQSPLNSQGRKRGGLFMQSRRRNKHQKENRRDKERVLETNCAAVRENRRKEEKLARSEPVKRELFFPAKASGAFWDVGYGSVIPLFTGKGWPHCYHGNQVTCNRPCCTLCK